MTCLGAKQEECNIMSVVNSAVNQCDIYIPVLTFIQYSQTSSNNAMKQINLIYFVYVACITKLFLLYQRCHLRDINGRNKANYRPQDVGQTPPRWTQVLYYHPKVALDSRLVPSVRLSYMVLCVISVIATFKTHYHVFQKLRSSTPAFQLL